VLAQRQLLCNGIGIFWMQKLYLIPFYLMEGLFNQFIAHLSVVIPVYNESSLINEIVKRVKLNVKLISEDYEIIIVDDASPIMTLIFGESYKSREHCGLTSHPKIFCAFGKYLSQISRLLPFWTPISRRVIGLPLRLVSTRS
jgi:hypothetical protein